MLLSNTTFIRGQCIHSSPFTQTKQPHVLHQSAKNAITAQQFTTIQNTAPTTQQFSPACHNSQDFINPQLYNHRATMNNAQHCNYHARVRNNATTLHMSQTPKPPQNSNIMRNKRMRKRNLRNRIT